MPESKGIMKYRQRGLMSKVDYDYEGSVQRLNDCVTLQKNKDKILEWLEHCKALGHKKTSRTNYLISLYILARHYSNKDISDLSEQELKSYKNHLSDEGKAGATIDSRMQGITEFYKYLKKPEIMSWFKTKRRIGQRLDAKQILNLDDIQRLVIAGGNDRDKAIVHCLYESGCRASEFLGWKLSDVQVSDKTITIRVNGKTGERDVYLIDSARTLLRWIDNHPYKNQKDASIWISLSVKTYSPIHINGLQKIVRDLKTVSGIEKPIFPHAFRHARATMQAKKGMSESLMRLMFGWSRTSDQPSNYVNLVQSDVQDALLKQSGIKKQERPENTFKQKDCPKCNTTNTADQKYCENCFFVLDVKEEVKRSQMLEVLQQQVLVMAKQIEELNKK